MSNLPANPFAFKSHALETQLQSTSTKTTYNINKQSGFNGIPAGGFTNSLGTSLSLSRGQDLRSLRDHDEDRNDDDDDDFLADTSRVRSYRSTTSRFTSESQQKPPADALPLPPPAVDETKVQQILAQPDASTTDTSDALLWEKAFASINDELESIEVQAKQQESKQLDDMVYQVSKAIEAGEMIPLPTQSDKSKDFTRTVMELYNKDKNKTGTGKIKSRKQRLKSEIAAKKAEDRFDKFDAFAQNSGGSYRKSLQNRRKNERKKLDW